MSIYQKLLMLLALSVIGFTTFAADGMARADKDHKKKMQEEKDRQIQDVARKYSSADLADKIKYCSDITDRISRLNCYDDMSQEVGFIPQEVASREKVVMDTIGFWEITRQRLDSGINVYYLTTSSVEPVVSKSGLSRRVELVGQCSQGQTNVYLDWKATLDNPRMGDDFYINYRMDGDPTKQEAWELSLDYKALFSREPVEFLKVLQQKRRIVFTIVSENEFPKNVVFETHGLGEALQVLVKECYN